MRAISFLIASLAIVFAQGPAGPGGGQGKPAQPRQGESITLTQYMQSLHWDPAKAGPLIAIATDALYINDDAPNDLTGFEAKMSKAGHLSVIAQSWNLSLEDEDLPNAYQALQDNEKLTFLLATLNSADLEKLTGPGLSPQDLTGEQKAALVSLIPKSLSYLEGQTHGNGFRGQGGSQTVPDDQMNQVKLQLFKGLQVMYGATSSGKSRSGSSSLNSFAYRGPDGTPIVQNAAHLMIHNQPQFKGKLVDSAEKKSQISWNDPRLAKTIDLTGLTKISDAADAIRTQTGVEVYADKRIGRLQLTAIGTTVTASDLLRGLAIALLGVVRQVGPAYVLTADLEGTATREARLLGRSILNRAETGPKVEEWVATVKKRGILDSIGFSPSDPFQAGSIPQNLFAPQGSAWDANWVPLSQLPSVIQTAITQIQTDQALTRAEAMKHLPPNTAHQPEPMTPVSALAGEARIGTVLGYRLVLPDGRPLDATTFSLPTNNQSVIWQGADNDKPQLPLDPATLKDGSAVQVKSDDPNTVARFCEDLKGFKIHEVWLDSTDPAAIQAAIESGLTVDLVIHPWQAVHGETIADPDRNVLLQTGSQMNQIPALRVASDTRRTETFANSFSPNDPGLSDHWNRLFSRIPKKGINRIILQDVVPSGYTTTSQLNRITWPSDETKAVTSFGYTNQMRVDFLRKFQIDPIDLTQPHRFLAGPPIPYFTPVMFGGGPLSPYPKIHFPRIRQTPVDDSIFQAWQDAHHDGIVAGAADMMNRFSALSLPLYWQVPSQPDFPAPLIKSTMSAEWGKPVDWKNGNFVNFISINPLNAEDPDGQLTWQPHLYLERPFTFDLSEVPPARFTPYLRYIFKPQN